MRPRLIALALAGLFLSAAAGAQIIPGKPVDDGPPKRSDAVTTDIPYFTDGHHQLLAYPNPVIYKVSIELPHVVSGNVYVDIVNMGGNVNHKMYTGYPNHHVYTLHLTNTLEVDMSTFPPGTYVLHVYGMSIGKNYSRVVKQ